MNPIERMIVASSSVPGVLVEGEELKVLGTVGLDPGPLLDQDRGDVAAQPGKGRDRGWGREPALALYHLVGAHQPLDPFRPEIARGGSGAFPLSSPARTG